MQDEALGVFTAAVGIDVLGLVGGSKRRDPHRLGFAACEKRGTVRAGEQAHLAGKGADVMQPASVAALLLVEDADPECFFLQVVERLGDLELRSGREFFQNRGFHFLAEGVHGLAAGDFARRVDGGFDAVAGDMVGDLENRVGDLEERHRALGFADLRGELALGGDNQLHALAGEIQGSIKLLLGEFVRRAFDHDDVFAVTDVNEVEVAVRALVVGRVGDERPVDAADAHGADRAGERNVGNGQGGRCAVDREDVGIILAVRAEQERDDLGVVEIALREQGTERAIGHPANEDFFLGRSAFALEIPAGELSDGCGFFFVFDGEREKILPLFDSGRGNGCHEDDGVAGADGDGAVGEFGELAGFDGELGLPDLGVNGMGHIYFLVLPTGRAGREIRKSPEALAEAFRGGFCATCAVGVSRGPSGSGRQPSASGSRGDAALWRRV